MSDTAENDAAAFKVQTRPFGNDFMLSHDDCGLVLLVTQHVHLDTLARLAAEHECPIPPDEPRCNPVGGVHALWCPDLHIPPAVCSDCGHVHTPEGCTGDPTPSDRWAGVSVEGCDCAWDQATSVIPPR